MKRMCRVLPPRSRRGRLLTWREVFPHASMVIDANTLKRLNAEVAKRKQREVGKKRDK